MLATKIFNLLAGTGITVSDGREVALSSATQATLAGAEQTANKDQPNGYAGLNADGEMVGKTKVLLGTAAEILALTPEAAQPYWTSDTNEFGVGNNATAGGYAIAPDNVSNIHVHARHGSLANNGAALLAAYTAAKLRTPYGNAIARGTNEVNIHVHGGEYNIDASVITHDTSGINFISADGPGAAIISSTSATRFIHNNAGSTLRGLTFRNTTTNLFTFYPGNLTAGGANLWEDLFFDTGGSTAVNVMDLVTAGTIYGTYRRLRTLGARLIGELNTCTLDATALFEDCIAGNQSLGGTIGVASTAPCLINGTVRRCILNGSSWNVNIGATGIVEDCTLNNCFIPRLTTGATIRRTTILPASGTCLGNATDTAAIKSYRNNLRTFSAATPYGTNITNSVGTEAAADNLLSDNI